LISLPEPNSGECDGVAGTPPIADRPKRLDLACPSKTTWREAPRIWGHDNLRRFRKWCISSLHPNHLLNDQVLPTLGCSLLAEKASLLLYVPECPLLSAPHVGSSETPTTTITKYDPEDLRRLSNCLWQLPVAKVKPFMCSEFSHYRVEKLAIEDGKQTIL
jgi:hypothetical protein